MLSTLFQSDRYRRFAWFVRRQFDYELSCSHVAACLASLVYLGRSVYRIAYRLFIFAVVVYAVAMLCLDVYFTMWAIVNGFYVSPVSCIFID
jgi:hypothetical protein